MQKAETIRRFLKERKQFLQEQLGRYGLGQKLQRLNKDVHFYSQYINEYKFILQDPHKLERKAIELLSKTSIFQDFLRKHSFLASIFHVPGDPGRPAFQTNMAGLQTRAQVNQTIQQQFATSGQALPQAIQQNIQQAQNQVRQLKDKITNLTGGQDNELPNFKSNKQKTKSFLRRLEFGTNIQTHQASNYFPATSDIGISLGYKLNDKSIVGIGMAYALGLGSGWRDVQLSSQGLGLRSFLDWKLKGSYWISGGYEMNYRSTFNTVDQLKNLNAWQKIGLLGISKVVSLKTKFFKKTKISLLWDFLSNQQIPETKPIIVRVGYNFR